MWSEVSGTAKAGMHGQEWHMRHGDVVKVAHHTKGWLFTALRNKGKKPKHSHVDASRFSGKRVYLTWGELGLVSFY